MPTFLFPRRAKSCWIECRAQDAHLVSVSQGQLWRICASSRDSDDITLLPFPSQCQCQITFTWPLRSIPHPSPGSCANTRTLGFCRRDQGGRMISDLDFPAFYLRNWHFLHKCGGVHLHPRLQDDISAAEWKFQNQMTCLGQKLPCYMLLESDLQCSILFN